MGARALQRIEARPSPADWSDDEPMLLAEFVAVFWPNGPLTVTSLRTEINKGRLPFSTVAGKHFVTPAAVAALFRPSTCPDRRKGRGSTSGMAGSTAGQESGSPMSTSSETDRISAARAAARTAFQTPKSSSPRTSPRSGPRKAPGQKAEVIRLRC